MPLLAILPPRGFFERFICTIHNSLTLPHQTPFPHTSTTSTNPSSTTTSSLIQESSTVHPTTGNKRNTSHSQTNPNNWTGATDPISVLSVPIYGINQSILNWNHIGMSCWIMVERFISWHSLCVITNHILCQSSIKCWPTPSNKSDNPIHSRSSIHLFRTNFYFQVFR